MTSALPSFALVLTSIVCLTSCSLENMIRERDDLYVKIAAMGSPLSNVYKTYQYNFLDKYRITHQWTQGGCRYSASMRPSKEPGQHTLFFDVQDIYEEGEDVKQRGSRIYLNEHFREVIKTGQAYADRYGNIKFFPSATVGLRPMCFVSWWIPSHALAFRLHKLTMTEFEAMFSKMFPEGQWSSKNRNGLQWRVQEVSREHLRPRKGVGGPYLAWGTAVGNSGYIIAIEMTASQDSLAFPKFFDALEAIFYHLVDAVQIEPLVPGT